VKARPPRMTGRNNIQSPLGGVQLRYWHGQHSINDRTQDWREEREWQTAHRFYRSGLRAARRGDPHQRSGLRAVEMRRPLVRFGDIDGSIVVGSGQFIVARVPDGAASGEVVVAINGHKSNAAE